MICRTIIVLTLAATASAVARDIDFRNLTYPIPRAPLGGTGGVAMDGHQCRVDRRAGKRQARLRARRLRVLAVCVRLQLGFRDSKVARLVADRIASGLGPL